MIQRFKIEDLVNQDATGVVFRSIDSETNLPVAVRRFFPFGTAGSGLSAGEQQEYGIAVGHLAKVSHPALRTIICGGCDPVDGMPYIASEWIKGSALETLLDSRPLSEPEAIMLITQALEVCQLLSDALGRDGVWVEADIHTIIIGAEESRRPVTFWVSPLRWLGDGDGQRGLEPLIGLTTAVMGWADKPVSNLGATGLEAWLKWLHGAATTATLHEAREMLAATTGVAPSQQVKRKGAAKPKNKKSKFPVWIFACLTLLAMAASGWLLIPRNNSSANVFSPTDYEQLAAQKKNHVIVEGVFQTITYSDSGKTLYLVFSGNSATSDFRGAISKEDAVGDVSEAALRSIIGRKIRLNGKIKSEAPNRLVIDIKKRNEIQLVD